MNGESGKRKMIVDDFGVNLVCSGLGVNIPLVDDSDDVVVINCGSNFFSSNLFLKSHNLHFYSFYYYPPTHYHYIFYF